MGDPLSSETQWYTRRSLHRHDSTQPRPFTTTTTSTSAAATAAVVRMSARAPSSPSYDTDDDDDDSDDDNDDGDDEEEKENGEGNDVEGNDNDDNDDASWRSSSRSTRGDVHVPVAVAAAVVSVWRTCIATPARWCARKLWRSLRRVETALIDLPLHVYHRVRARSIRSTWHGAVWHAANMPRMLQAYASSSSSSSSSSPSSSSAAARDDEDEEEDGGSFDVSPSSRRPSSFLLDPDRDRYAPIDVRAQTLSSSPSSSRRTIARKQTSSVLPVHVESLRHSLWPRLLDSRRPPTSDAMSMTTTMLSRSLSYRIHHAFVPSPIPPPPPYHPHQQRRQQQPLPEDMNATEFVKQQHHRIHTNNNHNNPLPQQQQQRRQHPSLSTQIASFRSPPIIVRVSPSCTEHRDGDDNDDVNVDEDDVHATHRTTTTMSRVELFTLLHLRTACLTEAIHRVFTAHCRHAYGPVRHWHRTRVTTRVALRLVRRVLTIYAPPVMLHPHAAASSSSSSTRGNCSQTTTSTMHTSNSLSLDARREILRWYRRDLLWSSHPHPPRSRRRQDDDDEEDSDKEEDNVVGNDSQEEKEEGRRECAVVERTGKTTHDRKISRRREHPRGPLDLECTVPSSSSVSVSVSVLNHRSPRQVVAGNRVYGVAFGRTPDGFVPLYHIEQWLLAHEEQLQRMFRQHHHLLQSNHTTTSTTTTSSSSSSSSSSP
jgi:hypothetical protein